MKIFVIGIHGMCRGDFPVVGTGGLGLPLRVVLSYYNYVVAGQEGNGEGVQVVDLPLTPFHRYVTGLADNCRLIDGQRFVLPVQQEAGGFQDGFALVGFGAQDGHIQVEAVPTVPFEFLVRDEHLVVVFSLLVGIVVIFHPAPVQLQFEIGRFGGLFGLGIVCKGIIRMCFIPLTGITVQGPGLVILNFVQRLRTQAGCAVVVQERALVGVVAIGEVIGVGVQAVGAQQDALHAVHQIQAHGAQDGFPGFIGRGGFPRLRSLLMLQHHLRGHVYAHGKFGGEALHFNVGSCYIGLLFIVREGEYGTPVHQEAGLDVAALRLGKIGNDALLGQLCTGGLRQVPDEIRIEIDQGIHRRLAPIPIRENVFDEILFHAEGDFPVIGLRRLHPGALFPNVVNGGRVLIRAGAGVKEEVDGKDEVFIERLHAVLVDRIIRASHHGLVAAYGEFEAGVSLLGAKFVHTSAGKQCQQP